MVDHPGTVYLREVDLLPHLDGWFTGLFHSATLDVTLDALIAAHPLPVRADLLPHPDGWLSGLFDPANWEERFRVALVCS